MAGTPLVDAFEKWASEWGMPEGYINDVYLSKYEGCIPEQYLGDDVVRDIRGKFSYVLNFIADIVKKEKMDALTNRYIHNLIDADYEGHISYMLVVVNLETDRRDFIYYGYCKAWHYQFETREDFEKELKDIYNKVNENLTQLGIDGLR